MKNPRTAVTYFFCSDIENFELIEENNIRDNNNCAYVFKVQTPKICTNLTKICDGNKDPKNDVTPTASALTSTKPEKNKDTTKKMGVFSIVLIR